MRTIIAATLLVASAASAADLSQSTLRAAAQKGLALLEQTSPTFIKKGGCNSCHNQMLPAAAQAYARSRGIKTGPTVAQLPAELSDATMERAIEYATFGANSRGYELFAAAMTGTPADARLEAQVYYVKGLQEPEGYWRTGNNRPPLTFDDFTTTAYSIKALLAYSPSTERADTEARVTRARSWLLEAKPATTQERAFHLLGLAWSKASAAALAKAATGVQGLQRADGGWSQLASMPSDAFATGLALWAMSEGGIPATHPSYQKGLKFLLDTQAKDGTWHVKARSLPVQPYFESGYPYGHDQWISAAGAAYATMAIAAAVEPERSARR